LFATSFSWRPAAAALARVDGAPRFDFIEPHRPRPEALAVGTLISMLTLASFAMLFQPKVFPAAPAQLGEGSGGEPAGFESSDSNQQVVVGASGVPSLVALVADVLRDRYVDAIIGQHLANAVLAYEKDGRYTAASGPELAERITDDIYKTARAIGIPSGVSVADVVYSDQMIPTGPPPPMTEVMRERDRIRMLEQTCLFRSIEVLPRNIGYLKLDGFMPPSACQETVRRAMAAVNSADALIVDLRDNGGGIGETALQVAGYFFDRPAFLYDPRPHSRVPTHTASPISGSTLADKPVYVLTSRRTASAAEYFVYNLKMLKRVTLIGERTAGKMHAGTFQRLDDHFGIGIQEMAPPDNPYPVKGWEFIGIEPHVLVPGGDAVQVARTLAESRARRDLSR
jgi:Peptidase family S41